MDSGIVYLRMTNSFEPSTFNTAVNRFGLRGRLDISYSSSSSFPKFKLVFRGSVSCRAVMKDADMSTVEGRRMNAVQLDDLELFGLTALTPLDGRNMGVGLGYSLLVYRTALQGIRKLQVNEASLNEDPEQSWEVLAVPIQVMRRYAVPEPYEKLKELTRGRAVNQESLRAFLQGLELPEEAKANLLKLTPQVYVGAAEELATAVETCIKLVNGFEVV